MQKGHIIIGNERFLANAKYPDSELLGQRPSLVPSFQARSERKVSISARSYRFAEYQLAS
jgi:hypothetical protein